MTLTTKSLISTAETYGILEQFCVSIELDRPSTSEELKHWRTIGLSHGISSAHMLTSNRMGHHCFSYHLLPERVAKDVLWVLQGRYLCSIGRNGVTGVRGRSDSLQDFEEDKKAGRA